MSASITIEYISPATFVGIVNKAKWGEIGETIHKHLPVITKYLSSKLKEPSEMGPPTVRYRTLENGVELTIGFILDTKNKNVNADPEKNVQKFDVPGGQYAKLVHKGPYEKISDAWKTLDNWGKQGNSKLCREDQGWCFEKYLNDPETTKKEDLITELYWKLSSKRERDEDEATNKDKKVKTNDTASKTNGFESFASPICHIEYGYTDANRVKKFYSELFGWKITESSFYPEYLLFSVNDNKYPGLHYGGFVKAKDGKVTNGSTLSYLEVNGISGFEKKVVDAGGKVIQSKMDLPNIGYMAIIEDTEGNRIGLFEGLKK